MSWKFLLNPQFTVIKDSRQGHRVGLNNRRYSKEHFEDQHFFGRGTIISTCEIFPIWPKCSRIFPIEREQVPVPKGAVTVLMIHTKCFTVLDRYCMFLFSSKTLQNSFLFWMKFFFSSQIHHIKLSKLINADCYHWLLYYTVNFV